MIKYKLTQGTFRRAMIKLVSLAHMPENYYNKKHEIHKGKKWYSGINQIDGVYMASMGKVDKLFIGICSWEKIALLKLPVDAKKDDGKGKVKVFLTRANMGEITNFFKPQEDNSELKIAMKEGKVKFSVGERSLMINTGPTTAWVPYKMALEKPEFELETNVKYFRQVINHICEVQLINDNIFGPFLGLTTKRGAITVVAIPINRVPGLPYFDCVSHVPAVGTFGKLGEKTSNKVFDAYSSGILKEFLKWVKGDTINISGVKTEDGDYNLVFKTDDDLCFAMIPENHGMMFKVDDTYIEGLFN